MVYYQSASTPQVEAPPFAGGGGGYISLHPQARERKELGMARITCPECHGSGSNGWSFCRVCDGKGWINRGHNPVPARSKGGHGVAPGTKPRPQRKKRQIKDSHGNTRNWYD